MPQPYSICFGFIFERIASILKNRVKKYAVPYENNIILSKLEGEPIG